MACGRLGFDEHGAEAQTEDGGAPWAEAARAGDGRADPDAFGVDTNADPLAGEEDPSTPGHAIPGLVGTDTPSSFSCADVHAFRCSTFDDAALPEWDRVVELGGTVVAAQGALVSTSRVPGARAAVFGALPTTLSGHLYVRARMLVPSTFEPQRVVVARLGHAVLGETGIELAVGAGGVLEASVAGKTATGPALTPDRWSCVTLDVSAHASAGSVTAELDGAPALELANVDTVGLGIDAFDLGIAGTSILQLAATVLVDDVAVGPEPFACNAVE